MASPEPIPTRPSSSVTLTIVAGKWVQGRGPTDAERAGRAAAGGARCRWRRSRSSISALRRSGVSAVHRLRSPLVRHRSPLVVGLLVASVTVRVHRAELLPTHPCGGIGHERNEERLVAGRPFDGSSISAPRRSGPAPAPRPRRPPPRPAGQPLAATAASTTRTTDRRPASRRKRSRLCSAAPSRPPAPAGRSMSRLLTVHVSWRRAQTAVAGVSIVASRTGS
jgi:hypothetical protein